MGTFLSMNNSHVARNKGVSKFLISFIHVFIPCFRWHLTTSLCQYPSIRRLLQNRHPLHSRLPRRLPTRTALNTLSTPGLWSPLLRPQGRRLWQRHCANHYSCPTTTWSLSSLRPLMKWHQCQALDKARYLSM